MVKDRAAKGKLLHGIYKSGNCTPGRLPEQLPSKIFVRIK